MIDHVHCICDADVALCGADLSGFEVGEYTWGDECKPCDELASELCGRCGL